MPRIRGEAVLFPVSLGPQLQPAADISFCVYGFSFLLRTNHAQSRDAIVKLYREFLTPNSAGIGVEAVFKSEDDGFRWSLQEKTGAASDLRSTLWNFESALCE